MQSNLQMLFCKVILFSIFCVWGLPPQYAKAQAVCTNRYRVWLDCDANGQKDVSETGLQGVNVALYDANCRLIQQVMTDENGSYTFGRLLASTTYHVVFGNEQYANSVLNVGGKSHNLSPMGLGDETTDSDAVVGGVSPSCANGKPYVTVTTNALGCMDYLLDAGFVRLDFQLNSINVVHETCNGGRNGSLTLNLSNVSGGFSTLITGNTLQVNVATYSNLAAGTYNFEIRSLSPTCHTFYKGSVTITAGQAVNPPTVSDDKVCRNETNPQKGGLKATCLPCLNETEPVITWWTSQTGGYKVFTGATFNPIAQNWINTAVVGTASFWAQCACNGCVSPRVRANFVIKPRPEPVITGEKLPCPNATETYTTPSVSGSTYSWSLLNGGGTIVSTNHNSVTIKWHNAPNTGAYSLQVTETNKDGCGESYRLAVSIKAVQLSCFGSINASLDDQCRFNLNQFSVLGNRFVGSETHTVQVKTEEGLLLEQGIGSVMVDGFFDNGSRYSYIGKQLVYTFIEPCSGSSCWGYIRLEDKTPPMITPPADAILACSQVETAQTPLPIVSGSPTIVDCSTTETNYTDIVRDANCLQPFTALPYELAVLKSAVLPTTGDIVRIILRTFIVKDLDGNSTTCKQYIFIRKGSVQNVVCPKDFEIRCQDYVNTSSVAPSVTGVPLLDTDGDMTTSSDRFPIGTGSCKLQVNYVDQKINLCANSFKIARIWTVFDPCATDNPQTVADERKKECTQTIFVSDKTPPSVSASFTQYYVVNGNMSPRDTTVNFDGYIDLNNNSSVGTVETVWALGSNTLCGGATELTLRMKDEGCTRTRVTIRSDDSRVVMAAGYPQFDARIGETVAVFTASYSETGEYIVVFTASDACDFIRAKKTFRIKIVDNIKPNVVCKAYSTTTLTTTGAVRVLAESFNNASTDNCGIAKIEVRRVVNCQNVSDTVFKPYIDFYCCDVNVLSSVVLRVWDYAKNYNECMVNIQVEEKIKPICKPPSDKTIACTDYTLSSLQNFGKPEFWDNCGVKDTIYTEIQRLDNCKEGFLLRKWVISDAVGQKDSCQQLITIRGKSDFTVDFPDDMLVSCLGSIPSREQTKLAMLSNARNKDGHIVNDGCGVLAVEVVDDTLTAVPDACYKILRKISVIDWCKYNPNNYDVNTSCYGKPVCGDIHENPNWATQNIASWQLLSRPTCTTPNERRFRDADDLGGSTQPYNPYSFSDGLICYTQIIKVIDNISPVFVDCPRDTVIKSFASSGCMDNIRLSVAATDMCAEGQTTSAAFLVFKWVMMDATTNQTIKTGSGNTLLEAFDYARNYRIVWSVEDKCGNRTFCEQKVKVIDAKTPAIICKDVNAELMGDGRGGGLVQVSLSDLLPSSVTDNCTSSSYLLQHLTIERDAISTGQYPTVLNTTLTFTCTDAAQTILARVWTIDTVGNANYCLSKINIQDNLRSCLNQNRATVSGSIKTDNGESIVGVALTATMNGVNMGKELTNATGIYAINSLFTGNNYTLKPTLDDSPLGGITTFDVALMSKHILGITPFNTPYKIIAADVNRDGDISAIDMLLTRRMILRLQTAFPGGGATWRFVDKRYVFQDPSNPLSEDFPEVVNLNNMSQTAQADFVGFKMGDVSGNAWLGTLANVRGTHKALIFNANDILMTAGQDYNVTFRVDDFDTEAYQFTLNHTEAVEIGKIESTVLPDLTENNFARFPRLLALTTSWNGRFEGSKADAFSITFHAKQNTRLSHALTIGSNITEAAAYSKKGELMDVKLMFKDPYTEGGALTLYQNEPNPFSEQTKIAFHLPTETSAKLTIYDTAGRILKTIEQNFDKGYNEIYLTKQDIKGAGILYYRVETATHSAIQKMIVL